MADSSEPAFLFLYRKGAVAPVDYLSTFATAPFPPLLPLPGSAPARNLFLLAEYSEVRWTESAACLLHNQRGSVY